MVGQGGIILIRILKLRANSHDLMQLLKCTMNLIRKISSWAVVVRVVVCKVQRAVGNPVVCSRKMVDSAAGFVWLASLAGMAL